MMKYLLFDFLAFIEVQPVPRASLADSLRGLDDASLLLPLGLAARGGRLLRSLPLARELFSHLLRIVWTRKLGGRRLTNSGLGTHKLIEQFGDVHALALEIALASQASAATGDSHSDGACLRLRLRVPLVLDLLQVVA